MIEGVDLKEILKAAEDASKKQRTEAAKRALTGLLTKIHNQEQSVAKKKAELETSQAILGTYYQQMEKIKAGDWSAMPEFEVKEKEQGS
jgi:uncharacterized protein involved in exopolysaccharide biosynthesis